MEEVPTLLEFMRSLPLTMLRQLFMQDPVERAGSMVLLPVFLWALVILVYVLPLLFSTANELLRRRGLHATLFVTAVLWLAARAYPSMAEKGGGGGPVQTNATSTATGSVRLYYTDSNGHLVPLGAAIKGKP